VWFSNTLILTFDGIDQQFLTALDMKTGETIWRTDRTTDYGDLDKDGKPRLDGDMRKAYGTPALFTSNGQTQVISVGSRAAFGYDAKTGKELWTITHDDFNAAAQPLIFNDMAIINTGSRGANLLAVRLDGSTRGDVTASHVVWNREKGNSRLCFPALFEGRIYSLTDNGVISCIDAATGHETWTGRVGGNFVASPVIANGLVYLCDEEGRTTVVRTGDKYEVVTKNRLADGGKASPAVAGGAIFLRTATHVYKLAAE
jgi:outer membrane protein assembly factor BamB